MPRRSEAAIKRNRDRARATQRARNELSNKARSEARRRHWETIPFIGWDSEGYNIYAVDSGGTCRRMPQRTMLFGCSIPGQFITGPDLGSQEMLDLIIQVGLENPDAFHVGFAFEYDVNQILKDLPWRALNRLRQAGRTLWKGFKIKHVPHKIFEVVKHVSPTQTVRVCIYDVFGYFHCKFTTALSKYHIGDERTNQVISRGKRRRGTFTFAELAFVIDYWKAEISLFPPLMDAVRDAAYGGGFRVRKWHGPGALASYALSHNGAAKCMSKGSFPQKVMEAIRHAYCGGRFQSWRCGYHYGPVYTLDKNSAYVQAIAQLPNLQTGRWEEIDPATIKSCDDIARFGIYYIHFDAETTERDRELRRRGFPTPPYPLFHRDKNGRLTWPSRTLGWYWSPEARLVAGNSHARFVRAFVFRDDGTYPFSWVNRYYDNRVVLQRLGNPAEKSFKWSLAAMYGQFAQRVGWNRITRTPPRSHELAWAGYITSHCRAAIYDPMAYAYVKKGLISADTDGITSSVPFPEYLVPEGFGDGLGQWKHTEYTGILHWQNGIYWLRNHDGEWDEAKSRGVPKGRIDLRDAQAALAADNIGSMRGIPKLEVMKSHYIGYRQALQGQFDNWRVWEDTIEKIWFGGSPDSKGWHIPMYCQTCQNDGPEMHTVTHMYPSQLESVAHRLPWLAPPPMDTELGTIYFDWDEPDEIEEYGSDIFAMSGDIFREDNLEDRL